MHSAFAREHRVHGRSISHYRIQSTDLSLGGAYLLLVFACDISRKPWKLCADCSSLRLSDALGCERECCDDDYRETFGVTLFPVGQLFIAIAGTGVFGRDANLPGARYYSYYNEIF
jgi:hypothetical protein